MFFPKPIFFNSLIVHPLFSQHTVYKTFFSHLFFHFTLFESPMHDDNGLACVSQKTFSAFENF